VWPLCQRTFTHSCSTVFSQKNPTLHCQMHCLFFQIRFHWLADVWVLSERLYRSHYLSLRVSHWVMPHWSVTAWHPVCIPGCDPQSFFPQAQWVGMPFTFHPYLTQMASKNSCLFSVYPIALIGRAESREDATFSIAPFISCRGSGLVPQFATVILPFCVLVLL